MSAAIEVYSKIGKKYADHRESTHIELGRIIAQWQRWPDGPDEAPKRIQIAGMRARDKLFTCNLLLLVSHYNKKLKRVMSRSLADPDDFAQSLAIGFKRACEMYKYDCGYRFSTYASWWLMQSTIRYLESCNSIVHIPQNPTKLYNQLIRGVISWDQLAEGERDRVEKAAAVMGILSLDRRALDTEGLSLGDLVADPKDEAVIEDRDTPWQRFESDHPVCASYLEAVYGRGLNQHELAAQTGVSKGRISSEIKRAKCILHSYVNKVPQAV